MRVVLLSSINNATSVLCRGSVGSTGPVYVHGDGSARTWRQWIWRWSRVRRSICHSMDWCIDRHAQLKTARRQYVRTDFVGTCWTVLNQSSLISTQKTVHFSNPSACWATVWHRWPQRLSFAKLSCWHHKRPCCFSCVCWRHVSVFFGQLTVSKQKVTVESFLLVFHTYIFSHYYRTASHIFLGDSQPASRKILAVYPIFLFYFIISWLVISHSSM